MSLYHALAEGPATTYALAAATGLPRAEVARGVADLVALKHAVHEPRSRRLAAVRLTDAGWRALAAMPARKAAA